MRWPRARRDPKLDRLGELALFSGCSKSDLERIGAITVEIDVKAGKVLTRAGERGHEFFLIEEGTATATLADGTTVLIGPGECFGELALLEQAPRAATVTADTDMKLVVLDARQFSALMDQVPTVAEGVRAAAEKHR